MGMSNMQLDLPHDRLALRRPHNERSSSRSGFQLGIRGRTTDFRAFSQWSAHAISFILTRASLVGVAFSFNG